MSEGKIVGGRAPSSDEVYAASRGTDPKTGEPTSIEVDVADRGTVTTYLRREHPRPFGPRAAGAVRVGADRARRRQQHVLRAHPRHRDGQVRMGMRVKAVWAEELKPDYRSILHWEPIGRARCRLRDVQGVLVRDVAVVSYAASAVAKETNRNEVEIIVPVLHQAIEAAGIPARRSASSAPAASTTSSAVRSRSSPVSTRSARGRRSASRTSRWTRPGRCTKRGSRSRPVRSTAR